MPGAVAAQSGNKSENLSVAEGLSLSDELLTASGQSEQGGKNYKSFSIFGKQNQMVEIVGNELSGAVYYLISGHGGPDPGAIGHYNGKILCEDEYSYDITLRLAKNLIAHGAMVYMIIRDNNDGIRDGWYLPPDKDETCYPDQPIPLSQIARLKQQKDAVNQLYLKNRGKYQRLIVIHVDSRSESETIDVFFYYDKRSNTGKHFAMNLRNIFDQKYDTHQPGRGYNGTVTSRNLYALKYSYPVAAFIEMGNIQHERDVKRFIVEDNRQALANWFLQGCINDYRNNK